MTTVAIVHTRGTFKCHPVFVGGIKIFRSVHHLHLAFAQPFYRIRIHLYGSVFIGMTTADARAGNKPGMACKSALVEECISSAHNSTIVYIHILHKKPGAHTIVDKATSKLMQPLL